MNIRIIYIAFIVLLGFFSILSADIVQFELYKPQTAEYRVQDALRDPTLLYNDHPSIEFFEDKYVAVWQASGENRADAPGRRLYLSTTSNLINWTKPTDFLVRQAINPFVPSTVADERQTNPVLYNYKDKALWCIWAVEGLMSEKTNAGIHMSVLEAGSKLWSTSRIFHGVEQGDEKFYGVPTQKPIECRSGKLILPIRLHKAGSDPARAFSVPAFLYSTDAGKKWQIADTTSFPKDTSLVLNSTIHQQKDGRVRVFSLPDYRNNLSPTKRMLTTIGSGTELEDDLEFEENLRPAGIETTGGLASSILLSNGRYALVTADVYSEINGENMFYNPAVFFSRTGENDFVGGYPFAIGKAISNPQLMEYDNKLYIIYSQNTATEEPSSIKLSWIDIPDKDTHYIFPRSKDIIRAHDVSFTRARSSGYLRRIRDYNQRMPIEQEVDERKAVVFDGNSSAGLDILPVNARRGESITINMSVKILNLQQTGELVLFSVGDLYPVKIVMPSAREGQLYISAPGVYEKIADIEQQSWFTLSVTYNNEKIVCVVNNDDKMEVPSALASQKFYFGSNCQFEAANTNSGSAFAVDIESVSARANRIRPRDIGF